MSDDFVAYAALIALAVGVSSIFWARSVIPFFISIFVISVAMLYLINRDSDRVRELSQRCEARGGDIIRYTNRYTRLYVCIKKDAIIDIPVMSQ